MTLPPSPPRNLADTDASESAPPKLVYPTLTLPPIDGPLTGESRAQIVALMAEDLRKYHAFTSEADAVRSLLATQRYSAFHVLRFVDDARQVAMQETVAKEMSES